ncbi:MAG: 16S rRNA (cytosine(1402)-N(4))-methyltransferase RsmH [Candidatus Omnitrophota bacterium]
MTLTVEEMTELQHYPVMCQESIDLLSITKAKIIVDCTMGTGSHALRFLEVMRKDSFYIGIDRDEESLRLSRERLKAYEGRFVLIKDDFYHLERALASIGIKSADVFFFDLGISMYQLANTERGFSFLKPGPLDMRMDRENFLCAADLVNNLSEIELAGIFFKFGEERYARKIARYIINARNRRPFSTTLELSNAVISAIGFGCHSSRIHPATRVFQALRIAVNRELEALPKGIVTAVNSLSPSGRIGVISFHSLEDRIVKHTFREKSSLNKIKIITKRPLTPQDQEKQENPPSRSAKFRVAENSY